MVLSIKGNKAGRRVWSRRRRRGVQAGVVLVLVGMFVGGRLGWLPGAVGTDEARYHNKVFRVVKVVDGDTLDIEAPDGRERFTRVRLWGVDTPEMNDPEQGVRYYGPEATEFTREMVLGRRVRVVLEPFEDSRGLYGRLLAYVYLEARSWKLEAGSEEEQGYLMLNEELIKRGYGYADDRFRHILRDRFGKLQEEAQAAKRGLWAGVQPEQWPEWKRKRKDSFKF